MIKIKLTSYGAAQEVTGSCHLLEVGNYKLLIDCGLRQGDAKNYARNWENFLFDPKSIQAVILTHAHLDHCGRLPRLYNQGFRGKIYATPPTISLAKIVLEDSSLIMNEKAFRQHLPKLYSLNDLNKTKASFTPLPYYQETKLTPDLSFKIHQAGHILGAGIIAIRAQGKTIVFSGDIGGANMPLVKDIDYLTRADYVIVESTYGDRLHEDTAQRNQKLLNIIKRVTANNGTLLITIFALERTQDILKVLNDYYETHLDFRVPVFLDSPMAAEATKIYRENIVYLNEVAKESLLGDNDIFNFPHLKISNSLQESKKINSFPPPKIIMAGSGMLEGGRMIHHLAHYLPNRKNHLLFAGYQVPGTLGHKILNGAFDFNYYGHPVPIRAATDIIDGFSAHADKKALLTWLSHFQKPKKIFLVHGDQPSLEGLAQGLKDQLKLPSEILKINKTVEL
jgi:metallo-beta-lactamase family protein